jgi:hypothetical protein
MSGGLYRVPDYKPARRDSLYDRANEHTIEAVDAYMQAEFGKRAVALSAMFVAAFDTVDEIEAVQLRLEEGTVAVVYDSIDEVIVRRQSSGRSSHKLLEVVEPEPCIVARFSTSHGPADISNRLRKKMDNNDEGEMNLACLYAIIGLALDEPVSFTPLVDGTIEQEEPPHVQLHMVQ